EIVRRQALHYLREQSQARQRSMAPELLEGLSLALDDEPLRPDGPPREREALARCLKSLPPRSRRILSLRYEKRQSFEEIGVLLESSSQAIQRTISRLRQSLHDCIRLRIETAGGAGAP